MIKSRSVITGPTFLAMGLIGVFHAFWGTTLPALRDFLLVTIEEAALLSSANLVGQAVACLPGGLLCDLLRREKVLMFGCFMLGFGVLLLGKISSYHVAILTAFWMGLGCGLVIISSTAVFIKLYPDRKGPIINLNQVIYGGLLLVSPLIMGHLLTSSMGWQRGFGGLGVLLAGVGIFFLLTHLPGSISGSTGAFVRDIRRLFGSRVFIILLFTNGMGVGAQIGIMYYVVTLLTDAKGFSILHAGSVLSAFYICLFVGRLTCSWATLRTSLTKIIIILLLLQFAGLIVAWQGKGWISALGVAMAGLGCSGLFPCLLALTGTLFFDLAGTSMGALTSAGYVGGMVMVWASGYFSQKFGLNYGFVPIILGSLICCSFFLYKRKIILLEEEKS